MKPKKVYEIAYQRETFDPDQPEEWKQVRYAEVVARSVPEARIAFYKTHDVDFAIVKVSIKRIIK